MNRKLIFIACCAAGLSALSVSAQDASARSVQYHSQDIVPIHAKLKYTTLIELPATEKIMEAATGDKDFWIIDTVGNYCFLHPAKEGIHSNLTAATVTNNDKPAGMSTSFLHLSLPVVVNWISSEND